MKRHRRNWGGNTPRPVKTNDPSTLEMFWEIFRGVFAAHAAGDHDRYKAAHANRGTPPRKRIAPEGFFYNGRGRLQATKV